MKRFRVFMLAFVFVLALVGCENRDADTTEATTEATTETTTVDQEPTFVGVQDVTVLKGASGFNLLAGITVTDAEDVDLTGSIVVDGTVNLEVAGEYPITLTVTDSGNNSVTAEFTVTVELSEDEVNALADVATIQLDVNNLELPKNGENGSAFYWVTDRPDVITNKGFVINPGIGCDPVTVTLSVKVVNNSYREFHDFVLTVQPNEELEVDTITTRDVAFTGTSTEYVVADVASFPLYFIDGGNLPYVDIQTFLSILDGAMDPSLLTYTPVGDDVLEISYSVEWEDFDGSMVTEDYLASIDFTENTFTVNSFDFFENYVAETSSDYGEGLTYTDAVYGDSNEVTIPLGFYNFDIMPYDDGTKTNYLMPLHVADLIFMGGIYYDVYYNGDQLYGVDTFTLSGPTEEEQALLDSIRTSSYNDLEMPDDIKFYTYNFLGLTMDYFYGLRDRYDVGSYFEVLADQAQAMLESRYDKDFYGQVFSAAYNMDDLHTSHAFSGYYEAPYIQALYLNDLGPGTLAFYEGLWDVQDLLEAKYGSTDDVPQERILEDNKTAVFYIDGFDIETPNLFKEFLDGLPAGIENVVIDLSYNTGGNVGAVFRMFGYMTEETFMYHSKNPADGSTATYYISSDYVAYDYDWYINTSSVTFSAANLMAAMAKEQDIATIIGKNSSGGASSIGAIYAPDGTALIISTNSVTCTLVDGEYVSVEDGVEVDYFMYNVTSDSLIISTINQAKADREAEAQD